MGIQDAIEKKKEEGENSKENEEMKKRKDQLEATYKGTAKGVLNIELKDVNGITKKELGERGQKKKGPHEEEFGGPPDRIGYKSLGVEKDATAEQITEKIIEKRAEIEEKKKEELLERFKGVGMDDA